MDNGDLLRQLADIEAIKRLKARYFRLMDQKKWDEWAMVFSTDAHLVVPEGGVDEAADVGGAVRAEPQLLDQRDVGVHALEDPDPRAIVVGARSGHQVARHDPHPRADERLREIPVGVERCARADRDGEHDDSAVAKHGARMPDTRRGRAGEAARCARGHEEISQAWSLRARPVV